MNRKLPLFTCILLIVSLSTYAQSYKKLADGVEVSLPKAPDGNAKWVRLKVIDDKIIHVLASHETELKPSESLVTIPVNKAISWKASQQAGQVVLETNNLKASISLANGAVDFKDKAGKSLVKETVSPEKSFVPQTIDGKKLYQLTRHFACEPDEAFYGLGQHQTGKMNYRNESVTLLQQNTDVAVPFVMSTKNYGILWDNYSITTVGDTRKYAPIATLKLYDKQGNIGGLTASYLIKDSTAPFLVKQEQQIEYKYLNDLVKLPKSYNLAKGIVEWEGSIAANKAGVHKFFLFSSEYVKVWVDGELIIDRWRQNWNAAQYRFDIDMKLGDKHHIKIEWKALSSEAAISLQYLEPIAPENINKFGFSSEAGHAVDYYFVAGSNMDEVISGYRTLTGKATLLPKWALGFWQSRERYKTQEEVLNTVAEFRKRKIGLDNIVLDWSYWKEDQWGSHEFEPNRFPDAEGMIKELHEKYNTRFMISVWPKFYPQTANYKLLDEKGLLYKRNIELGRKDWIGVGYLNTFYDAYNPKGREVFWELLHEKLFKKGVDAWWMDASEPDIHSNVNIEDRKDFMNPTFLGPSTQYFNAYALQNAKGIYEGQRNVDNYKRVFILTRSGFAGLQRYAAATWSGDISSTWGDMKDQISAGVNFSMSGLPYWTMDIGGFAVEKRFDTPNPTPENLEEWRELNTRWYQFGSLVPLFRAHGQSPVREIFNIAPEDHSAYQSMLYYNRLRYRLMPYIYSLAGMAYHNDYTIMRGLPMDFPADKKVRNINDQFLFGPSLLVNPVTVHKATSRPVYLPEGSGWYNAYDGSYRQGGQTIAANAPYNRMPLFVREGSIIPMGPAVEYTAQKQADTLKVFVYTGKDGSFTLYEDEGLNYNYEQGKFSNIPFTYNEKLKTLKIGSISGSFEGMLKKRLIQLVFVGKNKPMPLDADIKSDQEILYVGESVEILFK